MPYFRLLNLDHGEQAVLCSNSYVPSCRLIHIVCVSIPVLLILIIDLLPVLDSRFFFLLLFFTATLAVLFIFLPNSDLLASIQIDAFLNRPILIDIFFEVQRKQDDKIHNPSNAILEHISEAM